MTEKDQLRRQAEALISQGADAAAAELSLTEARRVLHELRVHQIELEMQNEELRRAQTELDAARARYFDLYDLAPASYLTVNQSGLILEANLTAATLLNVTRLKLVSRPFSRFVLSDDYALYQQYHDALFKTRKPATCELRMVTHNGTAFWARLTATVAQDGDSAPVGRIVLLDITERKKQENERDLMTHAVAQISSLSDFRTCLSSLTLFLQEWSGCEAVGIRLRDGDDYPYYETRGFPPAFVCEETRLCTHDPSGALLRDVAGDPVLECMCGNILSGRFDPTKPFFTAHGSFWTNGTTALLAGTTNPDRLTRTRNRCNRDGYESVALVPLRVTAQMLGLIQFNDHRPDRFTPERITRFEEMADRLAMALLRRQDADALRASEFQYRSLYENMTDGFALHEIICAPDGTPADYRFLTVNPAFEHITGLKGAAIVGRTVLEVLPGTERRWIDAYGRVALTGEPAFFEDYSAALNKSFEVRAFRPAKNQFACIVSEVTDRKRAAAELQKMQKLQSVGTLAGGIAHDFNNIMQGLFGNISLAKEEFAQNHPGHLLLEEAEKSMNRAVRLTKQLLTFAKGGDPIKENVSLGSLVEEIARFDLTGSAVKLVYQQAPELWLAVVDKGQMQQVISNLTINARQAMPEGGSLHITLANADVSDPARPGLRPGKYVQIIMQDEGTGIDPKYVDRIFDPYFTTRQSGSGLGLATAYSIVNKHGGHIGVRSALGRGTTFTLYLPASGAPLRAETVPPAPAATVPPLDRPAKILVMDDEDAVCRLVERALTRHGFTVATAPGGQEAIALYQQAMTDGAPFDAAVLDLTIPGGLGGKDTLKELLAIDPHAKAIVSSGYADDPVMANYADYGFKGCVTKPYTTGELRAVLARLLK